MSLISLISLVRSGQPRRGVRVQRYLHNQAGKSASLKKHGAPHRLTTLPTYPYLLPSGILLASKTR